MPPEDSAQPTPEERDRIADWIRSELFAVDCTRPDPGRITLRRLNRAEYNNTVRDLLGVDFEPANEFPEDDTGYGFDNIGDVLTLPPVLIERYLAAAERVVDAALATPRPASDPRAIFLVQPANQGEPAERDAARAVVERFARRAFRRPATEGELERLLALYEAGRGDGSGFEEGVGLALQAALVSPHFLFIGNLHALPAPGDPPRPVDEFTLASRLSYFLWSSMPDPELLALAERGMLRLNLETQVRRMLDDPKSNALVDNFAGQWLLLRKLDTMEPDADEFPGFSETLRAAMRQETELFFERIMREDRSLLEFIDADWTYANAELAHHYGLAPPRGAGFRLVSLRGTPRGGLITQGSVLTLTSNPTRTSPVKRGKWVLDNLLGEPPPPPPPNVPELEETKEAQLTGTLRERMVQHREDPLCASCHARMDPLGFGLENFDGIGAWRDRDGEFEIDPTGRLVSGEAFSGPADLRRILLTAKRTEFLRCAGSKLLTYALGRGLEYYDECAVQEVLDEVIRGEHRFSALVLAVVRSVPFQMQRGEEVTAN